MPEPVVCVYGLWHLGCVTAACLAEAGFEVVGLDPDPERIALLRAGQPPIAEPGLADLLREGMAQQRLEFTSDPAAALERADVLWVTFDTPVDARDHADPEWVRRQVDALRPHVRPHTLVLVSSQVPVGWTARLEQDWRSAAPTVEFACSPENLRLGRAIDAFRHPERTVVGLGRGVDRERVASLFRPFGERLEWMSLHSAEMTKHALNGFLALSIAYSNELARICEQVGADATEVERGLRTDTRVGERAYVSSGPPIAGGTLARDVRFLHDLATAHHLRSPVADGILRSNRLHQQWARERLDEMIDGTGAARVALLGLTYKPDTDTLRRSAALELARWLVQTRGAEVRAFDPAVRELPSSARLLHLATSVEDALAGADIAVLATAWPAFRTLSGDQLVRCMRQPRLVDQAGFVPHLAADPRVTYVRVGHPRAST